MTYRIICLISVLAFLSCTSERVTSTSNETALLKKLEYDAISAEFRLDTAAIARVLHDNFIAIYPHKLQNKQQELAGIYNNIVNRKKEGETMDSLYLDDFRAQFYHNTAVVTFFTITKGKRKDVPYENQRWRWYDVWVKENEVWKLVSAQGTPVNTK